MADIELKSFPFDSMKVLNEESGQMEDDRLYEAQIFRDYFRKFLSNGVYFGTYKNYGENSMKVVLDTGLTIKVKKGCGIIEGVDYENENDRLITLDRPASGNRVDRVVVQMNSSLDTRMTKLIIKQGTGTTPAELIRTDNVYEICLAEVTVKSTSNIADGDIVDTRLDTTICGIVNSLISVDGEELYQRFQEYVDSVTENLVRKDQDNTIDGEIVAKAFKRNNTEAVYKDEVFNLIYPVGSIYMSVNKTNPSTLFGGTWIAWGAGKVPVGVNASETEFNSVEKTGGAKTHTLTTAQIPSHNHSLNNHTHSIPKLYGNADFVDLKGNVWNMAVQSSSTGLSANGICSPIGGGTGSAGYATNSQGVAINWTDTFEINAGHNHPVTTNASTTGQAGGGNTGNTGSGQAHNNLQPYITCYMWKRTA